MWSITRPWPVDHWGMSALRKVTDFVDVHDDETVQTKATATWNEKGESRRSRLSWSLERRRGKPLRRPVRSHHREARRSG